MYRRWNYSPTLAELALANDNDLEVMANVPDGSGLEFSCEGDSENFAAFAVYHRKPGTEVEIWKHPEIVVPEAKRKRLSTQFSSYAITVTIEFFGSDKTTVDVTAHVTTPDGMDKERVITVAGRNGALRYPRFLIVMASR
jgi:hypothetical protein